MTSTAPPRGMPMDPRIGRRRAAVTRARGRRRLLFVVVAAVVLALGAGALAALHSPLLSARHLRVSGAHHTSPARVLQAAGLRSHPPLIDVSPAADEARLAAIPWVARATVSRRWPDSVTVHLVERVPVAVVAGRGAAGGWFLVDRTGRVLKWQTSAPAGLPSLVTPAAPGRPGSWLGQAAGPGLEVVSALGPGDPLAVRSVVVGAGGQVRLVLGGGVQALLGPPQSLGPKLAALRSVLAGAPPTRPEVIDVTVPGEPTVAPAAA